MATDVIIQRIAALCKHGAEELKGAVLSHFILLCADASRISSQTNAYQDRIQPVDELLFSSFRCMKYRLWKGEKTWGDKNVIEQDHNRQMAVVDRCHTRRLFCIEWI
jgi:hypothetical protein